MSENTDLDFLKGGKGLEGITAGEIRKPWLKVAQRTTPEIEETMPETYIPALKKGDFFNSLTKKIYGPTVQVVFLGKKRTWLVYENKTNGKFLEAVQPDSYPVDKTNFSKWINADGEIVKEGYNFLVLIVGEEAQGPVLLPMFGMMNNDAKNLLTDLSLDRDDEGTLYNIFARVWTLTTAMNPTDNGPTWRLGVGRSSNIRKSAGTIDTELPNAIKFVREALPMVESYLLDTGAPNEKFADEVGHPASDPEPDLNV